MPNLTDFPPGFWLSLAIMAGLVVHAWKCRDEAWGIPAIAVCGTVVAWYHGDLIYNGLEGFSRDFTPSVFHDAWRQVAVFLASFWVLCPVLSRALNPPGTGRHSTVVSLLDGRLTLDRLQGILPPLLSGLATIWIVLTLIALFRTEFDWKGIFAPWLGHLAQPWARARVGGTFDFIFSVVGHVNLFCLCGFGIVAALAKSSRLRCAALALIALSWPMVFLDRTRHTMLAILLPGLAALVFVRLRRHRLAQVGVLAGAFLAVHLWFSFVIAIRSSQSVAEAFATGGMQNTEEKKHEGLNMFEELCWINQFMEDGTYSPDWGKRYFAEIVNVIPRPLWKDKPTIGLDYAVARGQANDATIGASGATISTGMIGGGLVNFGPWLGPPAAALLMAAWVALLAQFDLAGHRFGRLLLYIIGLVLTFNLGRDITLLVAYPLVFGYAIVWVLEHWFPGSAEWSLTVQRTASQRKEPSVPSPSAHA